MMRQFMCVLATLLVLAWTTAGLAAVPDFAPPQDRAQTLRIKHLAFLAKTASLPRALAYLNNLPYTVRTSRDATAAHILLARRLVQNGLLERATELYRKYLIVPRTYLAASYSTAQRNALWLELAKAWMQHGNNAHALTAINRVYSVLPENLVEQRLSLKARIYMAAGNYRKTVKTLRKWQNRQGGRLYNPFTIYNLGVALIRTGQPKLGAGLLNTVGTMQATDDTMRGLRDKANLTLAFAYLEIDQGATARALFKRIRLHGPFTQKALLGLGWSDITPDGEVQELAASFRIHCSRNPAQLLTGGGWPILKRIPQHSCGRPRRMKATQELEIEPGGETQEQRYQQALVPWLQLIAAHDPMSGAVQEALVAVPYAYTVLGANAQASQAYARAISHLVSADNRVTKVIRHLETSSSGKTATNTQGTAGLAWLTRRWGFADGHQLAFLEQATSRARFQQSAQNLHDLLALRQRLAGYGSQLTALQPDATDTALAQRLHATRQQLADLQNKIDQAIHAQDQYLRQLIIVAAHNYENRLQSYLADARAGQARLYSAGSGLQ